MFFMWLSILIFAIYGILILLVIIGFFYQKNYLSENNYKEQCISVVIAVRNEEDFILDCIQSLINQDYDNKKYEVIVVNDHSTDKTLTLLETIKNENVIIFSLPDGLTSKKEALRYAISKAKYNIIASTDGDCILPRKWLENIASSLNVSDAMLLGPVVYRFHNGFINSFQQLDMMAIQAFQFGLLSFKPFMNNAANLAYKKDKYNKVNGFDNYKTPSGDDIFLLEKFIKKKYDVRGILKDSSIVETKPNENISNLFSQRVRWASKSKFYKNNLLKFVSIVIFSQNIILLFIYSQLLFGEKLNYSYVFLLLSKWLIDFILLFLVAIFFKRKKSLWFFIPSQLIYPFYIIIVSIASSFLKFDWKGRKY